MMLLGVIEDEESLFKNESACLNRPTEVMAPELAAELLQSNYS